MVSVSKTIGNGIGMPTAPSHFRVTRSKNNKTKERTGKIDYDVNNRILVSVRKKKKNRCGIYHWFDPGGI